MIEFLFVNGPIDGKIININELLNSVIIYYLGSTYRYEKEVCLDKKEIYIYKN
jgi:hypothetical protein